MATKAPRRTSLKRASQLGKSGPLERRQSVNTAAVEPAIEDAEHRSAVRGVSERRQSVGMGTAEPAIDVAEHRSAVRESGPSERRQSVGMSAVEPAVEDDPITVVAEVLPADSGAGESAAGVEVLPDEDFEESPDFSGEPDFALISGETNKSDAPAVVDRSPAQRDALDAYLRDIAQYPPLSREEEHALAVKYLSDKDRAAAYKLVTGNLWLVVKIAREYERAARNLLDIIQEGNIGLMEAVKNFDPYRGVRFPSYAAWWVRAYIIRYVIANWRMVKIGTTQAQRKLFFNLKREKERLEREGFSVTPKLLAEKLDVREQDVVEMEQRLGGGDASLDAPVSSDDGSDQSLHNFIGADESNVEENVASREIQGLLAHAIQDFVGFLNERDRYIFEQRILRGEHTTLQEISEKLDISRERVRQIEERLRNKLKSFVRERLGDASSAYGIVSDSDGGDS